MSAAVTCVVCLKRVTFLGKGKDGGNLKWEKEIRDGEILIVPRGWPVMHFECRYNLKRLLFNEMVRKKEF